MNTKKWNIVAAALLLLSFFAFGGGRAVAAPKSHMIVVDDDRHDCPNADFTSIQAAVTAATPGTQIKVCAGVYNEQVEIPAGKDGLTIFSEGHWAAVIKAPPVMHDPGDIVRVNGAHDITLRDFVISGPLPDTQFCSVFTRTGVFVGGGGSASILNNHITEIRSASPTLRGCQNGIGVRVGRNFEGQVGSGTIRDNLIDKYQKGGVVVDGVGSYGLVQHNTILGIGSTPVIAQNGIQMSRRATGSIRDNDVSQNIYTPSPLSTGIILYDLVGGVDATHNNVTYNDYGIDISGDTPTISGVDASFNSVANSTSDGIDIDGNADSNSVTHNSSSNNGGNGIGLYNAATNNTVSHNQVENNRMDGVHAEPQASGNTIDHNQIDGNTPFDANDSTVGPGTAGTANYWLHNHCDTENRPGLCEH